jgi:hypothetical protein
MIQHICRRERKERYTAQRHSAGYVFSVVFLLQCDSNLCRVLVDHGPQNRRKPRRADEGLAGEFLGPDCLARGQAMGGRQYRNQWFLE